MHVCLLDRDIPEQKLDMMREDCAVVETSPSVYLKQGAQRMSRGETRGALKFSTRGAPKCSTFGALKCSTWVLQNAALSVL